MWDYFIKKQALSAKNDRLTGFIDPGGKYATEKQIDEMIPFSVNISVQINHPYSFYIEKMPELRIFRFFGKDDQRFFITDTFSYICIYFDGTTYISRRKKQKNSMMGF